MAYFSNADSGCHTRGHCKCDVVGERSSDDHNDRGGQSSDDDGCGGGWVICLEQNYRVLRQNPGHSERGKVCRTYGYSQPCSWRADTPVAVVAGRTWAGIVQFEGVIVRTPLVGQGSWPWRGWVLERLWLLAYTVGTVGAHAVEAAVG